MAWNGDIEPATIDQIREGRDGRIHVIDADAGGIADRLKRIDPGLSLRYSEVGDYYVVYWVGPDGTQELVATYQELDHRIGHDLERLEHKIRQPGYSYAAELDAKDAAAKKRFDDAQFDKVGEKGEELAHAIRKDLNVKTKITVPKAVD